MPLVRSRDRHKRGVHYGPRSAAHHAVKNGALRSLRGTQAALVLLIIRARIALHVIALRSGVVTLRRVILLLALRLVDAAIAAGRRVARLARRAVGGVD